MSLCHDERRAAMEGRPLPSAIGLRREKKKASDVLMYCVYKTNRKTGEKTFEVLHTTRRAEAARDRAKFYDKVRRFKVRRFMKSCPAAWSDETSLAEIRQWLGEAAFAERCNAADLDAKQAKRKAKRRRAA